MLCRLPDAGAGLAKGLVA